MNSAQSAPRRAPLPSSPNSLRRWLTRLWSQAYGPLGRTIKGHRNRRGRVHRVDRMARWRGSHPGRTAGRFVISFLGGAILIVAVAWAAYVVISGDSRVGSVDVEARCSEKNFSCGVLAGTLVPILSLALASAVFVLIRVWRVRGPYLRRAKAKPNEVVPTAGKIIGDIVGRDELCRVMIADLHDASVRRPHVVIGGVGAGKTALMVRLTKLLADRGAVPLAVRLRDAQERLDFRDLARRRFLEDADSQLVSDDEGQKVWRRLLKEGRIVVLADGLEEALSEGPAAAERDTIINRAIHRANEIGLPLIIASRPHDPLRGTEAAIVELEPLSEEAALQYVQQGDPSEDERLLDWIVETADVGESPLYLQITRQLHQERLLEFVSAARHGAQLDTRGRDRSELRLRLLDAWLRALLRGHFPAGVPLSPVDRAATVEQLSVLACIGLMQDTLQVKLTDFATLLRPPRSRRPAPIIAELQQRLATLGRHIDIRLATTWGTDLGLVEARGDIVQFPHSIVQAHLGSRLIGAAMADPDYQREALRDPGRELLIALVMHSRARMQKAGPKGAAHAPVLAAGPELSERSLCDLLLSAARGRRDVKSLDLYAAVLEVDSVGSRPQHRSIAEEIEKHWGNVTARDPRTLEEAQLILVRRFGEAARTITEQCRSMPDHPVGPAYRQLFHIACAEPSSYAVRLAAVQEIGSGGDEAFDDLEGLLGPPLLQSQPLPPAPSGSARRWIRRQRSRSTPAAQERDPDYSFRAGVARAWLAPLLVGSVTQREEPACQHLRQWLEFVTTEDRVPGDLDVRLSLQVALAQGFKYAANRRRRHPHARQRARSHLIKEAKELLGGTDFWFTRLTLVQALCLWEMPDDPEQRKPGRGLEADYKALVAGWCGVQDDRREHPFVAEARRLVVRALKTGQPDHFIWIDESGVVSRVGSRPASPGSERRHNLWIPPSTGWAALYPRAQRLVADVLLLLNLAERGDPNPSERERRLRRTNQNAPPPCLVRDRSRLDPSRTVGTAGGSEPGSNCSPGCPFGLCPYPPKGGPSHRSDLSEAFCRRQQSLLRGRLVRVRAGRWQQASTSQLRTFWQQMGQPAHQTENQRRPVRRLDRNRRRT